MNKIFYSNYKDNIDDEIEYYTLYIEKLKNKKSKKLEIKLYENYIQHLKSIRDN